MRSILIVLSHSLANLRRSYADNRIGGGVVLSFSTENFNAKCALLDVFRIPSQCLFNHKAEECREALAVAEKGIGQEPAQLFANLVCGRFFLSCVSVLLHVDCHGVPRWIEPIIQPSGRTQRPINE